jgi:hypothetical protein
MAEYHDVDKVIDAQLARTDLTPEDVLRLTVARRLNRCSENDFTAILSGQGKEAPQPRRGFLADLLGI